MGIAHGAARRWSVPVPLIAALVALVLVAVFGWRFWDPAVFAGGLDPDSTMRLVEVRDLLAGQPWYDLTQYRLAPPAGVVMHWSRLVDAPIAGLILLASLVTDRASAEILAANLWPLLLATCFLLALAAAAARLGGAKAELVVLPLACFSPAVVLIFTPGSIDHHNVQAVLMMTMIAALCGVHASLRAGVVAGLAAAASLAVGMEMLVVVIAGAAVLGLEWMREGERIRRGVTGYGLGFGLGTLGFFLATVAPGRWGVPVCDAISPLYVGLALAGGGGFAALARVLGGSRDDGPTGFLLRGAGLACLGCLLVSALALTVPLCLAGPYAALDPRLGPIWLDDVTEAMNIAAVAARSPSLAVIYFAPPLVTLLLLAACWRVIPAGERFAWRMLAAMLGLMLLVSAWQIRGIVTVQALALPLVAALAVRLADRPDVRTSASAAGILALLGTVPLVWYLGFAAAGSVGRLDGGKGYDIAACERDVAAALGSVPAGLVAAPWTLGAPILSLTGSSVLSAPYHRNTAGILDADLALTLPRPVPRRSSSAAMSPMSPSAPARRPPASWQRARRTGCWPGCRPAACPPGWSRWRRRATRGCSAGSAPRRTARSFRTRT
ncbi:hypothetical protein [Methylobrevis pamukkalensis]|uniref:Glycosyltransferase RgtA/B/C/D-like domain-containing protein n=1 Tax=Methylobrevis pamukkalensis TaxID=1439726 RepID=A0A1E3H2F4_9HYPH|nr:hypothetical protein [Methylobrevis pamukkalensis]ODN70502.1 hypothetical protein A6302_02178 [Methylobrevis pamukkalensis]